MDEGDLDRLLMSAETKELDRAAYEGLKKDLGEARRLVYFTDNCGEIVLDRLLLEQLKLRFPHLRFQALVRGADVLNDATMRDAAYTGMDRVAEILSNGAAVAGTVYEMLPEEARRALNEADVILAKGQGNYESLCGQGWHVFYAFLCKCELFTSRFRVPALTGMLVEEQGS